MRDTDPSSSAFALDDLTGLPAWPVALHRADRAAGRPCELLVLDFVEFARVNYLDTGFVGGDVVLRQFSAALAERLPSGATLARPEGDAFVAFWPSDGGPSSEEFAVQVLGQVLPALRQAHPGLPLELAIRCLRRPMDAATLERERRRLVAR